MAGPKHETPVVSQLLRQVLGRLWPGRAAPVAEAAADPAPLPMSLPLALALDRLRRGGALTPEDQAQLIETAAELAARQAADLTAADLMSAPVATVSPEADWRALAAAFVAQDVQSLPVADPQGRFLGLIAVSLLLRPGAQGLGARHLMQASTSLPPEAGFAEVLEALASGEAPVLPVVADDGTISGMITRTDIMAGLILAMVPN